MSAKSLSWSNTALFFPVPADWWRIPELKRIRRADSANAGRWFFLVSLANAARAEGKILASNGTPLTAEDFADDFGDDLAPWELLLAQLIREGLLSKTGTAYSIAQWSTWNRDAAKREARDEDSYRKKLERERDKLKEELESLKADVQVSDGRVQDENGRVHPVQTERTERKSRKIDQKDQTDRSERQKRMDALRARLCLADFSEEDFLEEAGRIHQRLRGKPLSARDREAIAKEAASWEGYAWGDRAGALLIAAQMTSAREKQGKVDKNPWFYAVRAAPSFLVEAADLNATNRVALELGEKLVPIRWSGGDSS